MIYKIEYPTSKLYQQFKAFESYIENRAVELLNNREMKDVEITRYKEKAHHCLKELNVYLEITFTERNSRDAIPTKVPEISHSLERYLIMFEDFRKEFNDNLMSKTPIIPDPAPQISKPRVQKPKLDRKPANQNKITNKIKKKMTPLRRLMNLEKAKARKRRKYAAELRAAQEALKNTSPTASCKETSKIDHQKTPKVYSNPRREEKSKMLNVLPPAQNSEKEKKAEITKINEVSKCQEDSARKEESLHKKNETHEHNFDFKMDFIESAKDILSIISCNSFLDDQVPMSDSFHDPLSSNLKTIIKTTACQSIFHQHLKAFKPYLVNLATELQQNNPLKVSMIEKYKNKLDKDLDKFKTYLEKIFIERYVENNIPVRDSSPSLQNINATSTISSLKLRQYLTLFQEFLQEVVYENLTTEMMLPEASELAKNNLRPVSSLARSRKDKLQEQNFNGVNTPTSTKEKQLLFRRQRNLEKDKVHKKNKSEECCVENAVFATIESFKKSLPAVNSNASPESNRLNSQFRHRLPLRPILKFNELKHQRVSQQLKKFSE